MDAERIQLNLEACPFIVRPNIRPHREIYHFRSRQSNALLPVQFNQNSLENKGFNQKSNSSDNSLEYLLSTPQLTYSKNDRENENKPYLNLIDFQKENLNKLKEDLIYYFSSAESLNRFKNNLE